MGAFDDLIPKAKEAAPSEAPPVSAPGGAFGDLMPKPPEKPAAERWSGSVLPISEGPDGKPQFDSNAGVIGGLKRAFTTPGDVYAGRVDPNSEEGLGRALEMASVFSPMPAAMRAGEFAIPGAKSGLVPAKVEPPTAEALKAAASKGYDTVRDMGVQYSTDAVTRHVGGLRAKLEQDGFLGELAPQTFAIISKFDNPPANSVVTSSGLEAARRAAGKAARSNDPTEREAARRLIQGLDQFVEGADPGSVVAGPAAAAGEALVAARGNYAASARSNKLQGVEERAELNAAKANSGFNGDNAVRQRADAIVSKPKESAGFNPEELEALKAIIKGNGLRNTMRAIGNLAGGGGGLGAAVSGVVGSAVGGAAGGTTGAVLGAATPLVGMAAKGVSNRMALGELSALDAATRMRSPLYQEMLGQAPMVLDARLGRAMSVGRAGALAALGQGVPAAQSLEEAYRRLIAEGGA